MGVEERLSLEAVSANTLIASEHVHRYALAARLCEGMRVLDLACGSGYGSVILRESAAAVTGVDNDMATVDTAIATVGKESDIRFEAADALELLSGDLVASYDAIVCFEGLEHFPDPEGALDQMARHATAGMSLVISVPNSKGFEEENEFHLTDYGYEEAVAAFSRFDQLTVMYQFLAEGSLIRGEEASEPDAEFVLREHGDPEWANHFIACVNLDERLAELGESAHMRLAVAPLHNRWIRTLERANRELWRENGRIARQKIGLADSAAVTMAARVQQLEQQVQHLEGILAKPRHQAVERARDRLGRLPLLDRLARSFGRRVS
ncbi:MAG: class I SAM-dependent methyltransferase [Thermoleophilaceae bacterium]